MKLEHPHVQLSRHAVSGHPDNYALHAVTYFNDTRYVADGHDTLPTAVDADGVWRIQLKVATNQSLNLGIINPVVHTIDLGAFGLSDTNPLLEVEIFEGTTKKGSVIVHDDDSDDFTKPGPLNV